ncbi:MAG: glycosyltransferase [Clostridia bacterium]|nr:glycosyltransferase [Clostridia bacterium]
MKILILSCNTGEGHNTAARAIAERCEAEGHEAQVVDFLGLGRKHSSAFISNFYIRLAKYFPYVFGFFYNAMLLISRTFYIGHSIVYWLNARIAPRLGEYLKQNHFDAVVMTHMFPADAIARLKHKGVETPLSIMVATDYTCYPFLEEAVCDYYVLAHEDLMPVYAKRKIPVEKLCPFGIPVSMRFANRPTRQEAREHLEIAQDEPCYLVMGGSMGAGRMKKFAKKLSDTVKEGKILVICGKNERLRAEMEQMLADRKNVRIIGFTTEIPYYMSACDVLYTKPGGLTSTEALVCHTPTVHTAAIPGCETDNLIFFRDNGLAIPAKRQKKQIEAGYRLANDPKLRAEMQEAQMRMAKPDTTLEILRLIEEKKRS